MLSLAKYIPMRATAAKVIWARLSHSENMKAAKIVAVRGCISNPIDPFDGVILPIPNVIKNWPPNWQTRASKNKLIHSKSDLGKLIPESSIIGIIEKRQQKRVV